MAKAVRIRIRSGNEEHTSVDSLRKNFDLDDIIPLLDGRLERWLRQKQENELADNVHTISANVSNESLTSVFDLIMCFFPNTPHNIISLNQLAKYWVDRDDYRDDGFYLYRYLLKKGNPDAAMFLFENDVLPSNYKLTDLLSEKQGKKDPTGNIEYILGICYFEGKGVDKDIERGNNLINKAFDKNHLKAKQFVKDRIYEKTKSANHAEKLHSRNSLSSYWMSKSSTIDNINTQQYLRNFGFWKYSDFNTVENDSIYEDEKEIASFLRILTYIFDNKITDANAINNWLKGFYDSIVGREARFVNAIFAYTDNYSQYKSILNELRLTYCPAHFLINSDVNSIRDFASEWQKLKIDRFDVMDRKQQITYIIHHMFEF